ncbi:MAG: Smr/MutS family protein [Chloroflexota bacterium]|nr:Smr/MutS family protein [Chloroflexota bacterium]
MANEEVLVETTGSDFTQATSPFIEQPLPLGARSLDLLGFPAVLAQLGGHASSTLGREGVQGLVPSSNQDDVARGQQETAEARLFIESSGVMDVSEATDVRLVARRAAKEGILTGMELCTIAETLGAGRKARAALQRRARDCPALAEIAGRIPDLDLQESNITRSLSNSGEVEDSASSALRRYRSQGRVAYGRLEESLQRLIRSDRERNVLQEPLITERNGRLVVPVKVEMRSKLPGLVHDVSGSGETIFVEPLAAVTLGNQWRELKLAEDREEERILRKLSTSIGDYADEVELTLALLSRLDIALAKGRYAITLGAVQAATAVTDSQDIRLVSARHPLLRKSVVPISLELGHAVGYESTRGESQVLPRTVLLITGPNGGGKTVTLKTLGLLALMHQTGLQVPAADGTVLPIFDNVYADIGDQQSIEQSLSTFTSHLSSVKAILSEATTRSLVLMDELGTSTDPEEGAALAEAVLYSLSRTGVTTIATTHLRRVAAYVQETDGMVNASVELDPETFEPTYGLTIGLPGRSYALTIAARVGLPREVVERAQSMLEPEHRRVDELLAEVVEERQAVAEKRAEGETALVEAQELRREAEIELERLRSLEVEQLQSARHELQAQAQELMAKLQAAQKVLHTTSADPPVESVVEVQQAVASVQNVRKQLRSRSWRPKRANRAVWLQNLAIGDSIRVQGFPGIARVLADPDNRGMVEISVGSLRAQVPLDRVMHLDPEGATAERTIVKRKQRTHAGPIADVERPGNEMVKAVSFELDLRGMRVDDALVQLDTFLDKALLDGASQVRVIHGVGTGALRSVVRERLGSHTVINRWAPEEGRTADGATIADLA